MIVVRETSPDEFELVDGADIVDSLDGERRAPLSVILAESWTVEERAEFGIYRVEPVPVPAGQRALSSGFARVAGEVVQVHDLEPIPLEELKAAKWEQVKRERDQRENGSASTPFGAAQADDRSKLKISGLVQMATMAAANGQPLDEEFTLADNSVVVLNGPMAIALGIAVSQHVSAIYATARSLRTAIEACASPEDLATIDIAAAPWP